MLAWARLADEAEIRKSLRGILEEEGYKVAAADSAESALNELKKRRFDVQRPFPVFPAKRDIFRVRRHVSKVPGAVMSRYPA